MKKAKNIIHILLLIFLFVSSCAKEEEEKGPTLTEVYPVRSPTQDPSPEYTFSTTKAGTINYGGSCSSETTNATEGKNTITFLTLSDGTYSDCTITVTDSDGKVSNVLAVTTFIIDRILLAVSSISPTENQTGVLRSNDISVTFSEEMDTTSITTNTSNTSCSGSFQLSSDNFSSCIQMSSSPSNSNGKKTFTITPSSTLSASTTYKARVTTGVKDLAGNALSSQYETTNGFTTSVNFLMGGSIQGTELSVDNVTTLVTGLFRPRGLTTDGENIYTAEHNINLVRKIVISTGEVSILAGQAYVNGSNDATGTDATFIWPSGITTDGKNLYVGEWRHTIRKIEISTGVVTTFAGTAGSWGSVDGTGTEATFKQPAAITNDGQFLYVADVAAHLIRKINISTGLVSTYEASWNQGIQYPGGITTDGQNLYISCRNNHTILKMSISTGEVSILAGSAGSSGSTDGTGASARFNEPLGLVTDGINLYVAEFDNNIIRKIVISSGEVTTIAGKSEVGFGTTDGEGTSARFSQPAALVIDGTNLYVADRNSGRIRTITGSSPKVYSFSTTADNQSSVAITDNITVTFSEKMDNNSITTNTDNSSCYGTLRVSSDNFSNCVQMASSPLTNDNKTFTLDPSDNLTSGKAYLTRVTTGVKDTAGYAMSSQYDNSTGFTTASFQPQTKAELQTALALWGSDNSAALSTYGEINTWDVSLITDMSSLFSGNGTFNDDIGNWDVSNVTNFDSMFFSAGSFNNNSLDNWDVSSATNMRQMFYGASSFNGNISGWDVSSVNNMRVMFSQTAINQNLSNWNVSNVTDMYGMFERARSFNQDISAWDISSVSSMDNMFSRTNDLSDANKCLIHTKFDNNSNWPYDWSGSCD